MGTTDPIMINFGLLRDLADEIITIEKTIREHLGASPQSRQLCTGERNAVMRCLATILAGQKHGDHYRAAYRYLWAAVLDAETLPTSGDLVTGLRKYLEDVTV